MPDRVKTRDAALSPNVVVAAVIALVFIACAFVVGVLVVGVDASSTPIVTSVIGLFAPTAVGLLALAKAVKVDRKTDAVNDKVDGHISRQQAIVQELAAHVEPDVMRDIIDHNEP